MTDKRKRKGLKVAVPVDDRLDLPEELTNPLLQLFNLIKALPNGTGKPDDNAAIAADVDRLLEASFLPGPSTFSPGLPPHVAEKQRGDEAKKLDFIKKRHDAAMTAMAAIIQLEDGKKKRRLGPAQDFLAQAETIYTDGDDPSWAEVRDRLISLIAAARKGLADNEHGNARNAKRARAVAALAKKIYERRTGLPVKTKTIAVPVTYRIGTAHKETGAFPNFLRAVFSILEVKGNAEGLTVSLRAEDKPPRRRR